MAWWRRRHEATGDEEAEKALAAIFNPSHAAAGAAPDTSDARSGNSGGRRPVGRGAPQPSPSSASASACADGVAPATQKYKEQDVVGLSSLPPSPILGYTLREEGLVDELAHPPRTLSLQQLRSLIVELSAVEQQAKYCVEAQLPQQVHNRGRRSLEIIVSPCLYACGLYLMLWKAPRLYLGVTPRSSVLFTRLLALMRWHLPEVEKERMARNHRWLLQATNARVTLSFLAGCTLTAVAVATQPARGVLDSGPDVELGMQSVGFQKHSEAVLRWLWCVYYHHPAYKSLAQGTLPPFLQSVSPRS
ncbi:uncharacterized protein Tco025E_03371 [Trypanosoma conorhini]|uniref:Uncharacterized protein n=1 Tax=Trypanosoma conorhini TaxID=83891 RepID=A0A3R7L8N4_9TRYP|nr:uncharacterized protein Tco025E_03371 [Trypanosoma conorhini]RNF22005.1 hypothetical protein Tco025E_03371 [Trypanosoma conorhini]